MYAYPRQSPQPNKRSISQNRISQSRISQNRIPYSARVLGGSPQNKVKTTSYLPRSSFLNLKTKGRSEERPILVGYSQLLFVVGIVPKDCHEHECTKHDYSVHRRLDYHIFLHSASFNRVAQGASGLPYTNSGISSPPCVLR